MAVRKLYHFNYTKLIVYYHIKYRLYCIVCDEVVFVVKALLLIFLLLFTVLGLCDVIFTVKLFFYYPGIRTSNYTIIYLNNKYALKQLNFVWQKIKWYGDEYACGIIAITNSLNEQVISQCRKFVIDKNITLLNVE